MQYVLLAVALLALLFVVFMFLYKHRMSSTSSTLSSSVLQLPLQPPLQSNVKYISRIGRIAPPPGKQWTSRYNIMKKRGGINQARNAAARHIQGAQRAWVERKFAPGGSGYLGLLAKYGEGPMKAPSGLVESSS